MLPGGRCECSSSECSGLDSGVWADAGGRGSEFQGSTGKTHQFDAVCRHIYLHAFGITLIVRITLFEIVPKVQHLHTALYAQVRKVHSPPGPVVRTVEQGYDIIPVLLFRKTAPPYLGALVLYVCGQRLALFW